MRSGLVILTALLLSGSAAVAQQAGKPCADDINTLCAGIQPGEGRIKACIKSHLTDLSPTCDDRVLTVAVTRKVCKTDVTNLCGGVVPGTGGIRACIKSHMAAVSDPCKDAMSRAAVGRKILGRRGPLEIIVRERGPSSEAEAGFDGRLIINHQV
jgi:hypothetical protein